MPRWYPDYGRGTEVVPDLAPFEVDNISKSLRKCNTYAVQRRERRVTCSSNNDWPFWPWRELKTSRPWVVYHDGRAYNHLAVALYEQDPCKYYRNVSDWVPQRPRSCIPVKGHYEGLGKPPVRQFFKLRPLRVQETRTMPAYELVNPSDPKNLYQCYKWLA